MTPAIHSFKLDLKNRNLAMDELVVTESSVVFIPQIIKVKARLLFDSSARSSCC